MPAVKNTEDVHQESMSARTLVTVDVQDDDIMLDSNSRRPLWALELRKQAGRPCTEELSVAERRAVVNGTGVVGEDDSAGIARVHNIFDADGDAGADYLLHGEGMDNLGAVEGQLSSLGGRDGGKQSGSRDLAWVRSKDAIDLLPDLELLGPGTNSDQSSTEIGVTTANGVEQSAGHVAKVAGDDGDFVAACCYFLAQILGQVLVEHVVQTALDRRIELDHIAQVDELRRRAAIVQDGSHVPTAQLLAFADDLVLGAVRHLLQVLGRLEDLDQTLALGIHVGDIGSQDLGVLQDVPAGLDVVGADGLDDVVVTAVVGLFGSASGAEEAVGGSFELRVGAACGADYSRAVRLKASSVVLSVSVG
jgi:hypothetical protein